MRRENCIDATGYSRVRTRALTRRDAVAAHPCRLRRNAVPAADAATGITVLERRPGDVPRSARPAGRGRLPGTRAFRLHAGLMRREVGRPVSAGPAHLPGGSAS